MIGGALPLQAQTVDRTHTIAYLDTTARVALGSPPLEWMGATYLLAAAIDELARASHDTSVALLPVTFVYEQRDNDSSYIGPTHYWVACFAAPTRVPSQSTWVPDPRARRGIWVRQSSCPDGAPIPRRDHPW